MSGNAAFPVLISKEILRQMFVNYVQAFTDEELQQRMGEPTTCDGGFLDNTAFLYDVYRDFGDFGSAINECLALLERLQSLNQNAYVDLHKGTPFYWLGACSFAIKDYESAIYYINAAVSEDIKTNSGAIPIPYPPSIRFSLLQDDGHAAPGQTQKIRNKIEAEVSKYNLLRKTCSVSSDGADISFDDVQVCFLKPFVLNMTFEHYRALPTSFLTYFAEWDDRVEMMSLCPGGGTFEPFFLHLFKGCLLFESLLKANPIKSPSDIPKNGSLRRPDLGNVLQQLHRELGIEHNANISAYSFSDILTSPNVPPPTVECAILRTGKVRNTLGHNLGWKTEANFTAATYDQLASNIAQACLHAIYCLYLKPNP